MLTEHAHEQVTGLVGSGVVDREDELRVGMMTVRIEYGVADGWRWVLLTSESLARS
jgi:hypothetical protein